MKLGGYNRLADRISDFRAISGAASLKHVRIKDGDRLGDTHFRAISGAASLKHAAPFGIVL